MTDKENTTHTVDHADWRNNFSPEYTFETLQRVQRTLLEMMKEIDAIFRANGIPYFISWGTLLGAVRHGGFIPWDDDLDICVFESEYEKAINLLRKHLSKSYIVHDKLTDPGYWCDWAKIRYLKSETVCTLWPEDNNFKYKGVCMDVYKVNNATFYEIAKKENKWKCVYSISCIKKSGHPLWKKCAHLLRMCWWELLLMVRGIYSLFANLIRPPQMYVYWTAEFRWKRIFPSNSVQPVKDILFEGMKFSGPRDTDEVLRSLYGNYLQLPPVDQRRPHYDKVIFYD